VRREYGANVTNNEAEYRTLIAGLEDLADRVGDPADTDVVVLGDSQLVMHQVRGEWRVKAANLRPHVAAAQRLARRFRHVEFRWHRRDRSVRLLGH
jgi:ribonuclease HI